MKIHQIYTNSSLRNFTYLIEFNNKAICIDPFYPNQVLDFIKENNLELITIINTHSHQDHICGNEGILNETNCELWISEDSKNTIPNSTKLIIENEEFKLDEKYKLKFIKTPGHIDDHICILVLENESPIAIFSGDTLFNAGVGNCYSGNIDDLYQTITNHFNSLPDNTKVYPGHDYWKNNLEFTKSIETSNKDVDFYLEKYNQLLKENQFLVSTMEIEKKVNTFFRLDNEEIKNKLNTNTNKETFVKLRQLRNSW